ncbi:MAG: hypothetical protein EBZ48_16845, partial [Proteobacteria bacterium]|nr:hypothetical protein [Pseudomonadota bacterium]
VSGATSVATTTLPYNFQNFVNPLITAHRNLAGNGITTVNEKATFYLDGQNFLSNFTFGIKNGATLTACGPGSTFITPTRYSCVVPEGIVTPGAAPASITPYAKYDDSHLWPSDIPLTLSSTPATQLALVDPNPGQPKTVGFCYPMTLNRVDTNGIPRPMFVSDQVQLTAPAGSPVAVYSDSSCTTSGTVTLSSGATSATAFFRPLPSITGTLALSATSNAGLSPASTLNLTTEQAKTSWSLVGFSTDIAAGSQYFTPAGGLLTVTGTDFTELTEVSLIQGASVSSCTGVTVSADRTTLTCTVPSLTAGDYAIRVKPFAVSSQQLNLGTTSNTALKVRALPTLTLAPTSYPFATLIPANIYPVASPGIICSLIGGEGRSTTLPAGLSLNSASCEISGTPQ